VRILILDNEATHHEQAKAYQKNLAATPTSLFAAMRADLGLGGDFLAAFLALNHRHSIDNFTLSIKSSGILSMKTSQTQNGPLPGGLFAKPSRSAIQ
jgi:hypothetical protein